MQSHVVIRPRWLLASATLTLLAGLLAACSGSSQSAAPSESAGNVSSTSAGAASASPASSGSLSASASANSSNGQLGMIFEVNNTGWQKLLGAPAKRGMVVVFVVPNQPGAKAGIQVGDVITAMNAAQTTNANAANLQIRKLKVGDKVALTLERKSGSASVDITVDPAQQFSLPQMLDDQVKQNSKDARLYFLRGAYGQSDAKAAIDDYTKALGMNSDFVSAYVERGTLAQKTNPDQAMKDFDQAAKLDPSYEPLYVNRSVLFSAQKAYDKALADDKKAVELDSSDPAAYANLGIGLVNQGDPTQALAAENQALQQDPLYGPALLYRGLLQRDAAKADLERAAQLVRDPDQRAIAQSALQKMS